MTAKHCTESPLWLLSRIVSLTLKNTEVGTAIPVVQMWKLRLREVLYFGTAQQVQTLTFWSV